MRRLLLALLALFALCAAAEAASRFAVCTTSCTWNGVNTAMWSATSGGATGASVPTSADTVTLDAATCVGGTTCTITVNTTVSIASLDMGACTASTTGCILDFSVNNNSVTIGPNTTPFNNSGTGTRNLKMGSGTWTVTSSAGGNNIWQMATTTNLTFDAGTSTIVVTSTATGNNPPTFQGGGKTYSTVTITANTNKAGLNIFGSNTFATLNINAPGDVAFAGTTTITNAFTWTGTSSNPMLLTSNNFGTTATISVASGTATMTWAGIRGVTFTGGATFSATNSLDFGGNSGVTITPPSAGGGGGRIIGG